MQPCADNDLVMSALSFAVQRLIHCPLDKTSGTLVFFLSTEACGLMIEWYDQPLYNFELRSWHTKVQASALQTFADVFNDNFHYNANFQTKFVLLN